MAETYKSLILWTQKNLKVLKRIALAVGGALVGLVNGLLGGGGGTLVVPCYELFGDMEEKKAHASAIATILPLSVVSGIIYGMKGYFELQSGLITTVGVMIGGIIGALLLKGINSKLLSAIFYGIMVYAGIKMVI